MIGSLDDDTKTVSLSGSEEGWPQFEAYDEAALNTSHTSVDLIQYCRSRYTTQVENVTNHGFFVYLQNLLQGTVRKYLKLFSHKTSANLLLFYSEEP